MDLISQGKVKTRKDHKCWRCTLTIPKGVFVFRTTSKDMGEIGTAYWCDSCEEKMAEMDPYDLANGVSFGDLRDEF